MNCQIISCMNGMEFLNNRTGEWRYVIEFNWRYSVLARYSNYTAQC